MPLTRGSVDFGKTMKTSVELEVVANISVLIDRTIVETRIRVK